MAGSPRRTQIVALGAFAAIVVVVLIVVSIGGSGGDSEGGVEASAGEASRLFDGIPQRGTVLGDPDAPATLTEFGDLQCPFCAEFAREVLPVVVDEYVKPGKLKLDFQALTFIGPDSLAAARMAEAAGLQDQLWEFIDVFYANQGTENSGYADEAFLTEIASAIPGLDVDAALADRDSPAVDAALADADRAAAGLGIDSTPSFVVDVPGAEQRPVEPSSLDVDTFTAALDAALGDGR